jgi:C-terminal processing protease CtpA/Prc
MPYEAAWELYYEGEGDFPQDSLGIVLSGFKRASENPDIENVILDLSCNSGGSPDVMMAILAVATGQTQLYGIHKLTGRNMTFTFEADTNFDGIYDEKDKEVKYDFNYGVLVTRHAFSCGNLFPIIAQEAGAVLIGEPSSGGSCCVQVGTDAEGFTYMMSSAQWQLTDSEGNAVEGGCTIDMPIETKNYKTIDSILSAFGVDEGLPRYDNYFDDAYLEQLMNEWFQVEAQEDVAA